MLRFRRGRAPLSGWYGGFVLRQRRVRPPRNRGCGGGADGATGVLSADAISRTGGTAGRARGGVVTERPGSRVLFQQWIGSGGNSAEDGAAVCTAHASGREPVQGDRASPRLSRLHHGGALGHGAKPAARGVRAAGARLSARGAARPLPLRVLLF